MAASGARSRDVPPHRVPAQIHAAHRPAHTMPAGLGIVPERRDAHEARERHRGDGAPVSQDAGDGGQRKRPGGRVDRERDEHPRHRHAREHRAPRGGSRGRGGGLPFGGGERVPIDRCRPGRRPAPRWQPSSSASARRSRSRISPAAGRREGLWSRARSTARHTPAGRSGRAAASGSAPSASFSRSCASVFALNGLAPVSCAYSVSPAAHTSVAPEARVPAACSGDMYDRVPRTRSSTVWSLASSSLAMPKSVSVTVPSRATRMLAGFTSRCTIPRAWACARASHTAAIARTACSSSRPLRSSRSPSTSFDTR